MKNITQSITDLAQVLIKIDTSKKTGVNQAIVFLKKWAKNNKFNISQWKNNSALLIQTNPKIEKHLAFVIHLDVVKAGNWKQAFQPKIINDQIIGRGAVDDKGPLAVCLELIKQEVSNRKCNLSCLIVTDEETTNQDIIKVINSGLFKPDFCIVADGGKINTFDIGQKGIISLEVVVKTKGGHSAFETNGQNAALILNEFISKLYDFSEKLPVDKIFKPAFINISQISAKTLPYNMPKLAQAKLEICFPKPQSSQQWLESINKISNNLCSSKIKFKISIRSVTEPHLLTNKKWLNIIKTNSNIHTISSGGNNMAKDLFLAGIPACSHCPTSQYLAHCNNEKITISDLVTGFELYKQIINNFVNLR